MPNKKIKEQIIQELLAIGWIEDGITRQEIVRIPTMDCPTSCGGKAGGKLASFGGRIRMILPGTLRKVTIGSRTVNFYEVINNKLIGFTQFRANDLPGIITEAKRK